MLQIWLEAIKEEDFRLVYDFFSSKGLAHDSWHIMFEAVSVWGFRNGTLTISEDEALGNVTREQRDAFLEEGDVNIRHIHLFGNTIPKIPPAEDWTACFLKQVAPKEPKENFSFFDFETDQYSGEHIVNYALAQCADVMEKVFQCYTACYDFYARLFTPRYNGYAATAHKMNR